MFSKLLVANRGEIACRVMRTAKRLGIATVAVYSEADAYARHVEMADEAVAVGPAPAAESYLAIDRIVEACRTTGAEAVHPGYGFLSENAAFVAALEAAGITFVGPPASAISAMGDKIESKRIAAEAGVSTIPGGQDAVRDADEAVVHAREIGLPVMLKASAGGGGKGMRIARTEDEVRSGLQAAANEARSSFGDDRVFLEKFIERPRHIEIQVLADAHGTVLHLGERECSVQRRHQKVIEEAPSPLLDEETREAMGAQAVALARAVGYRSAGTVEFIADQNRNFYFLEMNTRLQVEHPVTELVYGLDLVEHMLRIAAGETLDIAQSDVRRNGWAIEARIYAEDPERDFAPSVGRLKTYQEPDGIPGSDDLTLRIDAGVAEAVEVPVYYDPMIAKLCVHGPDRTAAIDGALAALDTYRIEGLTDNRRFVAAVLEHPDFRAGDLSTDFIADNFPDGFSADPGSGPKRDRLLAASAVAAELFERQARGERLDADQIPASSWQVHAGAEDHVLEVRKIDGVYSVRSPNLDVEVATDWQPGLPIMSGRFAGAEAAIQLRSDGETMHLACRGAALDCRVLRPHLASFAAVVAAKADNAGAGMVLSPMPGRLISVAVAEGQEVAEGDALAVIEAMKMENTLRAERAGTVAAVHATAGDVLDADQPILQLS